MLRGLIRSSAALSRLRAPVFGAPTGRAPLLGNVGSQSSPWCGVRWMSEAVQDGISEKEAMERVLMIVKAHPKVNPAKLTPSSHFMNDLGLDSLDVVEVVMGFEEEFELHIPDEDADKLVSVPAAVDFVAKHPMSK